MPATATSVERTAAAAVAAVVAGLLLSYAVKRGLETSAPVWLAFAVFIGLILGTPAKVSTRSTVTRALLPSALLPVTYAGVWLVRFLAEWSQNPAELPTFGPRPSGVPLDTSQPLVQLLLLVFIMLLFLATLLVVSLASIGKRPIVMWLARVNKLGPEGFKRIQRLVEAVAGVITAVASAWLILR